MLNLVRDHLPKFVVLSSSHLARALSGQAGASAANAQLDDLYKKVVVEVRGHDRSVLDSYERFVQMTSRELDINLAEVRTPDRFIERWTVLKSRFSNRKHLRQYEMRTYFKEFEFKHLTGSTCDTLLEFIQRNLPEGVAMHVHKTRIVSLPDHFHQNENTDNQKSQ